MGLGQRFSVAVNITDPGADVRVPLLRVPTGEVYTVEDAYIVPDTAMSASTANYYQTALENANASGTAQTLISGTAGGTAGWAVNSPKQMAITEGLGDLSAGQYLNLKYDEEGTIAPGRFTVMLEVTRGHGGKA